MTEKPKHSIVFAMAPHPGAQSATLMMIITDQAWAEMQEEGHSKDLSLRKMGAPIDLLLLRARDEDHAMVMIKKLATDLDIELTDERGKTDFSAPDRRN